MVNPRYITITVRYDRQPRYGRSLQWIAPELKDSALTMTEDQLDDPIPSRTWAGLVDGPTYERFAEAWRLPCQWPSSSPRWRPRISPLVAIFSPRWWPRISPPTDWLVCGVLGEWSDPLPGGGLREPVAVLAVGDQHVRVVKEPFDGRRREALGHQLVEPARVNV